MNILMAFLVAIVVGLIAYMISGAIPFLRSYDYLVGLIVFVVTFLSYYNHPWLPPRA